MTFFPKLLVSGIQESWVCLETTKQLQSGVRDPFASCSLCEWVGLFEVGNLESFL